MDLDNALQKTGCAIFTNGECITSVERLPDAHYLLMTRRGVSILQCLTVERATLAQRYEGQAWTPAQILFIAR